MTEKQGRIHFVRTTVIGGLVFLVPVVALFLVLSTAADLMMMVAEPLADIIRIDSIGGVALANLLAAAGVIMICFIGGLVARAMILGSAVQNLESKVLSKLPGYVLIKGMIGGLSDDDAHRLHSVVARVANTDRVGLEIERMSDGRVVVLIPSSPNPWSGEVHIMRANDVQRLDVSMAGYMEHVERFGQGAEEILRKNTEDIRQTDS